MIEACTAIVVICAHNGEAPGVQHRDLGLVKVRTALDMEPTARLTGHWTLRRSVLMAGHYT